MYKPFKSRVDRSRGYGRFGGNTFRAGVGRRVKSFDPTNVINLPQVGPAIVVQEITHTFNDFGLTDTLKRNVIEKGYVDPTPIQDQSILPILEGCDLIGIANTGTGKTAAFLIPLLEMVLKNRSLKTLIVAPTRELAGQIRDELTSFSRGLNVYSALCIGGANMGRQISDLRRNPNFVIGTPGRIEDLIRTRNLNLSNFAAVVLDEADHMVDIGFIQNIRYIISLLPQNRQSLFFSATIDGKVREILQSFVKNPVTVSDKTGDTAQNVTQEIIKVSSPSAKIDELQNFFPKLNTIKFLFLEEQNTAFKNFQIFCPKGFRAGAIHGNKTKAKETGFYKTLKTTILRS